MAPSESERCPCGERACAGNWPWFPLTKMDLAECSRANSTRMRQSEDDEVRSDRGTVLAEGIWGTLHDSLLEKIIAMLPMKSIFQAALLSKSWRLNFHSHSFQSEIQRSAAASWKAYAPVYVSDRKELVGYESSSQRWHVLPNHWYLEHHVLDRWNLRAAAGPLLCWTSAEATAGPLLCWTSPDPLWQKLTDAIDGGLHEYYVFVTNPLTRRWRQLPTRPDMQNPDLVCVVCEGTEAYKVMLVSLKPNLCVQIFDSISGAWTLDSQDAFAAQDVGPIFFIDGVLYMILLSTSWCTTCQLVSFDVKENMWTEIPHLRNGRESDHPLDRYSFEGVHFCKVCVCGPKVMLVVSHMDKFVQSEDGGFVHPEDVEFVHPEDDEWFSEKVSVFELDLDCGMVIEVSTAPEEMTNLVVYFSDATGHGDCIYVYADMHRRAPIVYNVRTKEWHWIIDAPARLTLRPTKDFQWMSTSITYQPGLHPFLEV